MKSAQIARVVVTLCAFLCAQNVAAQEAQHASEFQGPTASDPAKIEEVLVTATKREERLQDVPIPINVVSGDELKKADVKELTDLQFLDPSVKFSQAVNSGDAMTIRGIGSQTNAAQVEKAVGVVIDGIVDGDTTGVSDVERVEVLRGPQGTLFGKNSTAGVISLTTRRPEFGRLTADGSARVGTYYDRNFNANVNIPVTDTSAMRLSAFAHGQNGRGYSVPQQKRLEDLAEFGMRDKFLWQATDDLSFQLIAAYSWHDDSRNNTDYITTYDPFNGPALASYGITPSRENRLSAETHPTSTSFHTISGSSEINYRLHGYSITALGGYRRTKTWRLYPVDPTGDQGPGQNYLPISNAGSIDYYSSSELRVASPKGEFLEYVAGLFYSNKKIGTGDANDSGEEFAGDLGVPLPPGVYLSPTNGVLHEVDLLKSYAAFEQGSLHLTDQLSLILGSRYTVDKNAGHFWYDGNTKRQGNYTFVPLGQTPTKPDDSVSGYNFSYRIGLQYKFTRDINVFASYATGYKGGGTAWSYGVNSNFKPEKVKNVEVGLKSTLFDQSVRLNAGVFYSKFKDFQVQEDRGSPTQPINIVIDNAGGLETKGVETSLIWRATNLLTLNAGVTYSQAIFTDYKYANFRNSGQTAQLAGYPLTQAPKWSTLASASYVQPLDGEYQFDLSANYAWRSSVYMEVGYPPSIQGGFGLLGANIGFGPDSGKWRIGAYGRNLLNTFFYDNIFDTQESAGPLNKLSPPLQVTNAGHFSPDAFRTVGLIVEYKF